MKIKIGITQKELEIEGDFLIIRELLCLGDKSISKIKRGHILKITQEYKDTRPVENKYNIIIEYIITTYPHKKKISFNKEDKLNCDEIYEKLENWYLNKKRTG